MEIGKKVYLNLKKVAARLKGNRQYLVPNKAGPFFIKGFPNHVSQGRRNYWQIEMDEDMPPGTTMCFFDDEFIDAIVYEEIINTKIGKLLYDGI